MLIKSEHLKPVAKCLSIASRLRFLSVDAQQRKRRPSRSLPFIGNNNDNKRTTWWAVDGEMHEVGENVPPRERFAVPRVNIPNRRRKQLRDQFMRRTRLVLRESEHEPWCKRYLELYQELREDWERLYWDEGYSKKIAETHANYESEEDDNQDFNPYRSRRLDYLKDNDFVANRRENSFEQGAHLRDKFEYDRARRMREKAFAPMHDTYVDSNANKQSFDAKRYFVD